MGKKLFSLLLIAGLFFACGDDDSSSPDVTGQPPEVVAPTTTMNGPQTSDPAAAPVNAMVTLANAQAIWMAPLTAFSGYLTGNPTQVGDSWTWTYTFTDPETGQTVTVTVTATLQSDGWYWSITYTGSVFDSWVYLEGFTALDELSGWWKFYDPDTGEVAFSVTWQGDDESGSMDWYEGDFQSTGTLEIQIAWEDTAAYDTVTITLPEDTKYTVTEFADGSGELFVYEWENDDWVLVFEAQWSGSGSGSYTDYSTDPPTVVTWG